MTDNRPYIELEFTGDTLTQYTSNTLIGTNIVIDYGDGTTVNYNGDYSHTYSVSGDYTIRIYGVTSIGNSCFRECTGLTSIVIPDGVTSIGEYCFYTCTDLTSIVIPNSVTSLKLSCFNNCSDLTNIVIPNSVTSLGADCFRNCTSLTSIVIPDGVTSIGNNCFKHCTSLTSVIIPSSVTSIVYRCFEGCTGLTSVIIPSSVTNLGISCFVQCTSLTNVVIPNSVTSLSDYCFALCTGLVNIQLNWTSSTDIITYNSSWIEDTNDDVVFIIPQGTTSLYSAKGYPTAKLVEQNPPVSSHELFSDVKTLFLNNKEVKSIVINEPNGRIIYKKTITLINTNLTIEVPALVYSDVFDITGLLTDDNNNPISGASVKLYRDGSILEATETTDSNGEVTFHRSAPTSITTYTFQLVFDGDNSYSNSSSSVVTRNVNTETTILNLTSPLNNATYYEGETIPIEGTLTTNDGEEVDIGLPIAVNVYDENDTQLRHLIVRNGTFSGNINALLSAGNHSITVKFEAPAAPPLPDEEPQLPSTPDEEPQSVPTPPDEETEEPPEPQLIYAPSQATRNITINANSLTLTSNKNILSASDEEVATLTATLNASDNANKTVTFKKGGTILDTVITDSNGKAEYEYTSQGVGDIIITAECMNLQETYSIEDCLRYNSLTSNDGLFSAGKGGVSASYSSNGLTVLGNRTSDSYYLSTFNFPSSDFSIEYTLEGYVFNQHGCASDILMYGLFIEPTINGFIFRSSSTILLDSPPVLSQGDVIKFEITSNTVKLYINDTYYVSGNKVNTRCGFKTYNQRSITVKDMKIKPLFQSVLSLSSDKEILSYADEDSCTLTATLTDNNNIGISGEIITFKKGSTILDTVITDSNGEAEYEYTSQGAGDVTITATYDSKQATCNISDYPAIYIDNCDGTQKQIFTTTAEGGTYKTFSYTTYGGYQCLNHNTNFGWYPPSNSGNMLIEFDMYPRGSWGGTSIRGANGARLVWYMQGSQYNDMSYQIAVKVPSQWNKCKILIQDGVVTAWLNDNQIGQITTTVTHPLLDEMGSGSNPCYIKNLKIIELP